jgi:hypothetical protein
MQYTIIQTRTYRTTIVVEAENLIEAEDKYFELIASGHAFDEELSQMDITDNEFQISPSHEK